MKIPQINCEAFMSLKKKLVANKWVKEATEIVGDIRNNKLIYSLYLQTILNQTFLLVFINV